MSMSTSHAANRRCQRAYHVDWNQTNDVWDVLDEEGRVLGHCGDESEATALAINSAHADHGAGHDVIVCVQETDGGYRVAWASHRTS